MPPSDLTAPVGAAVGSGVELPKTTPDRATATPHHLTATRSPASVNEQLCSSPSAANVIVAVPQSDLRHAHAEHHQRPERPLRPGAAVLDTLHPLGDQDPNPRLSATKQTYSTATNQRSSDDYRSEGSASRSSSSTGKHMRARDDVEREASCPSSRHSASQAHGRSGSPLHAACSSPGR